jgi:epoxyqueuosine reductase
MNPDPSNIYPDNHLQFDLVREIKGYVLHSPLNRLRDIDDTPTWEEPLVGFADGHDLLFAKYKEVVGEAHLTPLEALQGAILPPERERSPDFSCVGVVSWILPAAKRTKLDNRKMKDGPSLRWNHSRFQGEEFNDSLRKFVVSWLEKEGYLAVAPVLTAQFKSKRFESGWASNWSERHIAFAAGLGTFSLSDGLITAKGIAHRCGSVVANVQWQATARDYQDTMEYCSFRKDGSCGACIQRCPVGAISSSGHYKDKCRQFLFDGLADWLKKPGYMGSYGACGLCQTGVPCESRIPRKR